MRRSGHLSFFKAGGKIIFFDQVRINLLFDAESIKNT